jgi:hypothetical protein
MNVKKLIELLSDYPENTSVRFLSVPFSEPFESGVKGVIGDNEIDDTDEDVSCVYIYSPGWFEQYRK